MCDVVPMQAGHILLGRPWQFDRNALHDGKKNRYNLEREGKRTTLLPLSPKEIHDDQLRLQRSYREHYGIDAEKQEDMDRDPDKKSRDRDIDRDKVSNSCDRAIQ